MFIDLDNFKLINDNYGHEFGDNLLIAISERLVNLVRPGDTVGRFAGDEFIVICDQISDTSISTQLADRIVNAFKQPILVHDQEVFATLSIGLVTSNNGETTAEEMFRGADAAMYSAKERGRDGWVAYDEAIISHTRQQLEIANGLRGAIKNQELHLVYQPIVNIHTNTITGTEALLRWIHEGKMVGPDVFIPIGYWVFEQACRTMAQWEKQLKNVPYISINLSARQVDEPKLVQRFQEILDATGVDPEHIVLEITETSLLTDVHRARKVIQSINQLGIRIAIDDFGTGYSSLSQLSELPVSTLKVDRSFINNLTSKHSNMVVTQAIIKMAHTLGLKVTAEGVENKQQLEALRNMECDNIQGYYYFKPVLFDEVTDILKKNFAVAS